MSAEKLWEPSDERVERAAMTAYMRWLKRERGVAVGSYEELWSWSVAELEEFWALDLGLLRRPLVGLVRAGPGRAHHARRALVRGRGAELRGARLP